MIRDGIKTVAKQGACKERPTWPYVIGKFDDKPPKAATPRPRSTRRSAICASPRPLNQLKGCLASGFPFVFGFAVYESFESPQVAKTGQVPMPQSNEALLGGHAVLAVGYDEAKQRFIVRNSWGKGWGMKGYFTMPYPYLLQAEPLERLLDDPSRGVVAA